MTDAQGGRLVLLGLDLHAATRRVVEAVAAQVADLGLGADNIFPGASHTHSGPGNFYGWSYYDTFAGRAPGRNDEWVAWLATRIGSAVRALVEGPSRPARVGLGVARARRLTVNRSKAAFRANRLPEGLVDTGALLRSLAELTGASAPGGEEDDDERVAAFGVDPRVRVLWFEGEHGEPIGGFASFGAHNTVSRADHRILHGDAFGVALAHARRELGIAGRDDVPLALVSGATGDTLFALPPDLPDASPAGAWWKEVNETLHLSPPKRLDDVRRWRWVGEAGRRLGNLLAAAVRSADPKPLGPDARVGQTYRCVRAPGAPVGDGRLADHWMIGAQVSSGGPWEPPWSEVPGNVGEALAADDPQAPKIPILLQGLAPAFDAPDEFPFRFARIGPYTLAGVPGEPTTWLAGRIERRALRGGAQSVMVCGYSGDYCGYLTTPAEYVAQDYEGSSTLWGRRTGDWVVAEVDACREGHGTPWVPKRFPEGGRMPVTRRMAHGLPRLGTTLRVEKRKAGAPWTLRGEWFPLATALTPLASRADPAVDVPALLRLEVERGGGWLPLEVEGAVVDDADPTLEVWLDLGPGRFGFEYPLPYLGALIGSRVRFVVVHPDYAPADPISEPTPPLER